MSLPSLSKTWQFIPNYAVTATGTALGTNRTILLAFKNFLTTTANWVDNNNASTTPANMWTVRYSCNSSVAGSAGDGVDRWSVITDLVFANSSSARSWTVLRQTAIGANCDILICCENNAANQNITLVFSPSAGFTGGTTTARPTATDEIVILNGAAWGGVSSSDTNVKLQAMKSSDGQCWRLFCCNGGQPNTSILIDKAVALHSAWTHQGTCYAQGANANNSTLTNSLLNGTANFNGRGVSNMTMFLAGMAAAAAQLNVTITAVNDLSSEWPLMPQQLFSNTASNKGLHGYLNDVWYSSTTIASGSTAPTTGTQHQFAQLGVLVFPWCKVAMQVT